jgi:hypothetical protein
MTSFYRYDDADHGDVAIVMPSDELNAATSRLSLGELLGNYEAFCNDPAYGADKFPWAKGFAMGFPLPSFQRDLVWTEEQKVKFIQSIWSGVDLGTYLVNDIWEFCSTNGTFSHYRAFSGALLDGQQRLTTIQEYITNGVRVPDFNSIPRLWRELGRVERRRFCQVTFTKATISSWDEETLRRAYDLRAFGGSAHKESERASR